jgi:hypothetical protein
VMEYHKKIQNLKICSKNFFYLSQNKREISNERSLIDNNQKLKSIFRSFFAFQIRYFMKNTPKSCLLPSQMNWSHSCSLCWIIWQDLIFALKKWYFDIENCDRFLWMSLFTENNMQSLLISRNLSDTSPFF